MKLLSPCKINLSLKVFEKNTDGYHRVETLMVKVGLCDEIHIDITGGDKLTLTVEGHPELETQDNLIIKAVRAFESATNMQVGANIRLVKRVPMGAGLGGGSANAGVVLRALFDHYDHPLSKQALLETAQGLGADVAFFVMDASWGFFEGRGDQCAASGNVSALPLVICHPGVHLCTSEMYKRLSRPLTWNKEGGNSPKSSFVGSWEAFQTLVPFENDFESVITEEWLGEISQVMNAQGALHSALSGSGSAVFGLFEHVDDATQCAKALEKLGNVFVTTTWKV